MNHLWLVIDCHNLCWKNHHALRGLSHDGSPTGVTFGLLRDWATLHQRLRPYATVWCWDVGIPVRKKAAPSYKSNRLTHTHSIEEAKSRLQTRKQMHHLRLTHLPDLGFSNVLSQMGYEADDLMASVCQNLPEEDEAILVSTDKDLYQLLSGTVRIWTGKKEITLQSFHQEWGLLPSQWAMVKAMAGCESDGVIGIKGVGEKTAANYLLSRKVYPSKMARILAGAEITAQNLPLVTLPYPGTAIPRLERDKLDRGAWDRLCDELGMESLKEYFPRRGSG